MEGSRPRNGGAQAGSHLDHAATATILSADLLKQTVHVAYAGLALVNLAIISVVTPRAACAKARLQVVPIADSP